MMLNVPTVTQPVNADVKTKKNVHSHAIHHVKTALAQLPTTVSIAGVMPIVPTQNSNPHVVNAISDPWDLQRTVVQSALTDVTYVAEMDNTTVNCAELTTKLQTAPT